MWVERAVVDDGHVVGASILEARHVREQEQEVRDLRQVCHESTKLWPTVDVSLTRPRRAAEQSNVG